MSMCKFHTSKKTTDPMKASTTSSHFSDCNEEDTQEINQSLYPSIVKEIKKKKKEQKHHESTITKQQQLAMLNQRIQVQQLVKPEKIEEDTCLA